MNKRDPKLADVTRLFAEMDFKVLKTNTEIRNKEDKIIGEIDLIVGDDDTGVIMIVEISIQKINTEKIRTFFTKWRDEKYIEFLVTQCDISRSKKIIYMYFDLSGDEEQHASLETILSVDGNYYINKYNYDYFINALDKVGKWAKSDFISYLNIKPSRPSQDLLDGLQYYLNSTRAFMFMDSVNNLLRYCYISRRLKNDKGYQRVLDKGRIGNIYNKILSKNMLAFPNTILVTSPPDWTICDLPKKISECPSRVQIKVPRSYSVFKVIDGQHRLLGFSRLSSEQQKEHYLPVIALENIDKLSEMRTFIEINSSQKKIDRNLILLLEADTTWDIRQYPKEHAEKCAVEVVKKLNINSTLKGKIYLPEALATKKNKVTLATLVSAIISNNLVGGKYSLLQKNSEDIEGPYKELRIVFGKINEYIPRLTHDRNSFMLTNQGLRILMKIIQIYKRNESMGKKIGVEEMVKDLKRSLTDRFVNKIYVYYGQGGANKATEEIMKKIVKRNATRYKGFSYQLNKMKSGNKPSVIKEYEITV